MSPTLILAATLAAFIAGWFASWPYRRRLRHQLRVAAHQLHHDPLTGLANRAGLTTAHTRWIAQHQSLVLILADLDGFKSVNDTHGHDIGDHLLAAVAATLHDIATAHGGIAVRLAGDEFALLLPIRSRDFGRLADLTLALIADTRINPTGVAVTASIGVHAAEHTTQLDQLLRAADIALYHAKKSGGATHNAYHPGMAMPANRSQRLREHRSAVTS